MKDILTIYKIPIIHCISLNTLEIFNPGLICIDNKGIIVYIKNFKTLNQIEKDRLKYQNVIEYTYPNFLIPGFIDCHVHAPQYSNIGIGMDLPLLEWLEKYTFPEEIKYKNMEYASKIYNKCVTNYLRNGTTTCSYFGTIHLEATKILTDIIDKKGQRALIGKVNMDQNCRKELCENTEQSIKDTIECIEYIQSESNNSLLQPVITPRFVPCTSIELMKKLGLLAKEYNVSIQSHLSENIKEIEWVKELHNHMDTFESYTSIYDQYNLLTDKTYMAHCIYCNTNEINLLYEKKVGIIHCPNSNFSLSSGILNVRKLLNKNIKVGLGTDVSGGYSSSMLNAIRQSIIASKMVSIGISSKGYQDKEENTKNSQYEPLNYIEAFYLATLGGAQCLNLDKKIGNFIPGKEFDALIIEPYSINSLIENHDDDDIYTLFQRFLFTGDDRNIKKIFISGRVIEI